MEEIGRKSVLRTLRGSMAMKNIRQFDAGLVFNGSASGVMVNGWDKPSPFTPGEDPQYVYPPWMSDIVAWLVYAREPLYLFGPTGCGKTSCIKQLMRKLNYPVYEVTGHNRLEFPEMVGHHTVRKGSMHYAYGPLATAMKEGGLFLLNEIDLLDPSAGVGLNSILDGYPLTIPENGGELILPHPMFKFVATANSNGGSDHTGLYQGVLRQNIAFMDRFVLVESSYMDEEQELELLKKYAGDQLSHQSISMMIRFANAVRRLFLGHDAEDMDTAIEVTFSTRTLIRWALLSGHFRREQGDEAAAVRYALDRALGFRASPASRMTLEELRQRIFG